MVTNKKAKNRNNVSIASAKNQADAVGAENIQQLGALYLLENTIIFSAQAMHNDMYTDYPVSVLIGIDDFLELDMGDETQSARGFLLNTGVKRLLNTDSSMIDFLIGCDSSYYNYVYKALKTNDVVQMNTAKIDELKPLLKQFLNGEVSADSAAEKTHLVLSKLFGQPLPTSPIDPRLTPVINYLTEHLPTNPSIEELAERANMSSSRLMHLFKQELGLPIRQYLLWKRVERGALLLSEGHSLQDISEETGFYDQAHFTRTVRRMVDIPPSMLTDSRIVQVINAAS